ncbi:GNAT family N-acetyltransferase [Staphylococcus edaphicus]|uniref:GNAT family N-acetyltransferase n=1 Tax=Staphylococcus edaphicus TaxID=1955013 RepID=A0A2C6U4M7_9STAP|nr:GNAT family N-acetyltransferase [Staphylococcus edaphicus]PHK48812.1 GNAT family N-acetyltransferase [Staphylococcus edaphicus]UQW80911.1 GNAT family N-acetyltransferase [Staphylococcus edaphicus]
MTHIRYLTHEDTSTYHALLLQGINKKLEVMAWKLRNEKCLEETNIPMLLSSESTDYIVIGAFESNVLIGAVTLIHSDRYSLSHKATLENMCVKGDNHNARERVATMLMHKIFEICNEKGIEILMTSLISNNISGKVFFSNLNFETLVMEQHARKYEDCYVDEHWLIYYFNSNDIELIN